MGLVDFARAELEFLNNGDDMNTHMRADILEIVKIFAAQNHSGMSASYAVAIISKLLRYEALSPLTGDDTEWTRLEYGPDMGWQNNRCSHVFKRDDGTAYDIEGRVFRDPTGTCFTGFESRVEVTFPYTPVREYVDVDENGEKIMPETIHPAPTEFSGPQLAADPILQYFHYAHLPMQLQGVSMIFCHVAQEMITHLPCNAERSAGLRKLLEAKDCAVRANVKPKVVREFDDGAPVEGEIKTTGGHHEETPVPFSEN